MRYKDKAAIQKIVAGILTLLLSVAVHATGSDPLGYALLIQQSPAQGGTVSPGLGIHKVGIGQSIELTATPEPGYRFLYWLGDVSMTSSPVTLISLDSPKMVVAVFERESFSEEEASAEFGYTRYLGAGGLGGLHRSPYPMATPGSASIGSNYGDVTIVYPPADDDTPDNPIPEPATIVILGLGSIALLRKRKR